MLIARPNAGILYATLAKGPKLAPEDQRNSTRHFMRELNRLGVTSAIDAGGGYQNYPDDYAVIMDMAKHSELTVRIAYNLFTQNAKKEIEDFAKWVKMTKPGEGDDFLRVNGAGEMLVFSAADFEDFLEPRPDLPDTLEAELEAVVRLLAANRWPFRLHATYDESIERFLNVFERVNAEIPFDGLRWFFDHCETITQANIERVHALGGGIAIQHRMAYQGEYFIDRYGEEAVQHTPPIRHMLDAGLPVGAGTDATRVASYNPFVSLYWLVSGKTVGGTAMYSEREPARSHGSAAPLYGRKRVVLERGRPQGRAGSRPVRGLRGIERRLLHRRRKPHQVPHVGDDRGRRQRRVCRRGIHAARAARASGESVVVAGRGVRRLQPLQADRHRVRRRLREPVRRACACAWLGVAQERARQRCERFLGRAGM